MSRIVQSLSRVAAAALIAGLAAGCDRAAKTPAAPAQAPARPTGAAGPHGLARQNGSAWVELGTQSGPIPSATRSEPAHLLLWRDHKVLVDAGDGAAEQLAKAHVQLTDIDTIFISHLHFDHTGGLYALLGLRYQGGGPWVKPLTIYGPPGTRAMVQGLRSAMQPSGALAPTPLPEYQVVELTDGGGATLGDLKVTAAANSHYVLWKGAGAQPVSLSYRFDMPGRTIVYTGDTGPSAKVEQLARGTDLLVSELMDVDTAIGLLKREHPTIPPFAFGFIKDHFVKEHLTADQVGLMAERAGARAVIVTHFGGNTPDPAQVTRLTAEIGGQYKGPVTFAKDLDRF